MNLEILKKYKSKLGLGTFFDEAQKHKNGHPGIISSMYKLSKKSKAEPFTIEFLQCLASALVQKEGSPYALTALDFAAKFCCHHSKNISEEEEDTILRYVITFITKVSDSKHTVARLRVCEFLNLLLSNMSIEATIDEEVYDAITQCMLDRAMDRLPTVRIHAFAALQRLQEPNNSDCAVTKKFIYNLECDPSAEVRKNILKNIAITPHSLPAIISRSRDFSEIVRKEMYQTIAKIKPKRLKIKQRQEILTNGLSDTSEVVRDHVLKKLIPKWLEDCDRDFLKLLELFGVEYRFSMDTVNTLLVSLFKRRPSSDLVELVKSWQNGNKVIPLDEITTEKALMWLSVVKYLKNPPNDIKVDEEAINEILPDLTPFALYIREYSKKLVENDLSAEYIFSRLLDLVLGYSITDENGREEMRKLCCEMLLSNKTESEELVKLLSKVICFLVSDVNERFELLISIINDIQHPLEDHEKTNLMEDSEIIESSYNEIPDDELKHLTAGPSTADNLEFAKVKMLPKCLLMLIEALKANDVICLNPVLDQMAKSFLTACFQLGYSYISSLAITILSLLCLKDDNFAKKNFIKFLYYLEIDSLELSSIEAIFDQLIFYGLDICLLSTSDESIEIDPCKKRRMSSLDFYDDPSIDRPFIKHLLNRLTSYLFSEVVEIRSVTSQGLAKLLLLNRIQSSFALAKLVILWFSPEYGSDASVSQPLGIFFDLYAKKVANAGEVILNSLIPALDHLTSKDSDELLASVDPVRVANLLLDALKKAPAPEEGPSYHFQAANLICDEILSRGIKSQVTMVTYLARCFYHLELSKSDKEYSEDLMMKLPGVLEKIDKLKEKPVKKISIGFYSKLNTLWRTKKSDSIISAPNQTKKSTDLTSSDDTRFSTDSEIQLNDGAKNNESTRSYSSNFKISEPILEECPDSDLEDEPIENEFSNLSKDSHVVPGTPDDEDSDSDASQPPPTRRKQRKLVFN